MSCWLCWFNHGRAPAPSNNVWDPKPSCGTACAVRPWSLFFSFPSRDYFLFQEPSDDDDFSIFQWGSDARHEVGCLDSIAISSPFVSTGVFRRCSSFEHANISAFRCLNFQFKSDQPPLVRSVAKWWNSAPPCHGWPLPWPLPWPRDLRRHQHGSWSDRCRHRSWTRPTRCPSRRLEDLRILENCIFYCGVVMCIVDLCGSIIHSIPFQYPFRFDDLGWSRWVHSIPFHSDSRISRNLGGSLDGSPIPMDFLLHWQSIGSPLAEGCPRPRRRSLGFEAALPRSGKALFQAPPEQWSRENGRWRWQSVADILW